MSERRSRKKKKKADKERYLQLSITDDSSSLVIKKTYSHVQTHMTKHNAGELRNLEVFSVKKRDGSKQKQVQNRLKVHRSSTEIVFNAPVLWKSKVLSTEQIANGLQRPFPLYNLSKHRMAVIIRNVRKNIVKHDDIVFSRQLLALAVLNLVDSDLTNNTDTNVYRSRYFKSRDIRGLSMGRRSNASRFLKAYSYIEEYGNCWYRTDKIFDPRDFWLKK